MSALTPEGKVKREIRKVLDKYKPHLWYFMPSSRAFGTAGVPDFVCCVKGRFIGVEAKAGRGKLSPLQSAVLDSIIKADGLAFVVYEHGVDELDNVIGEFVRNSIDAES